MKKSVVLILLLASFILTSSLASAANLDLGNLGVNNFTFKLDSIKFEDNALNGLDTGTYIGLEGYGDLGYNFYLGGEVGYAHIDKSAGGFEEARELIYVPIELNLKYSVKIINHLIFDLGAGGSYNYTDLTVGTNSASADKEWLWGGQFFGDLNYKIGQFFLGLNAKYQITNSGKHFDNNFNNLRLGGQIGVMF